MQDWWNDINKILSPTAGENLKYPTQKPVALLKRIVACASNPQSLAADFFAGAGTLAEAAEELGRRWIIADNSQLALTTSNYRLIKAHVKPYKIQIGDTTIHENRLTLSPVKIENCGQKNLLQVNIAGYQPDNPVSDMKLTAEQYIEYWEIDLNYQGCFHSDFQMLPQRRFNSVDLSIAVMVPLKTSYCIAVRVHDILGQTTTRIVNINY
jgi:site-specific DNA-methyltransferase (adenine-specific)